jgi:demethylmenaquinone methyltransferase/2-methoxy-6-polyprenyl-1,4-benzoquinol methylase
MSSLALMRLLESAPERYDAGMRAITLGRITQLHDAVARAAASRPEMRILEIGCGTGAVTERLAALGARVTALDQSPGMLELAQRRLAEAGPDRISWLERTASEIDALPEASFDAVVVSFCLSDMSAGERSFTLRQAARLIRPGGTLAVADEVIPERTGERLLHALLRLPQSLVGWLLAGATSHPIRDLSAEIRAAGFAAQWERRWLLGSLAVISATPPAPARTEDEPT